MKTVAEALCSPVYDEELLFGLVQCVRRAVALNTNPPIDLVVKLGLPEKIVALLEVPLDPIRIEAAWVITNIAAFKTEYCNIIRTLGCLKKLVTLLDTENMELDEQVV